MTRKHRFHICSHNYIWVLLRKCSRKHSKPLLNTSECFSSSFYEKCNVPYMVKSLIPFKRLLLIIGFCSYLVHRITKKSQILPPPLLPQKSICNFADLYANSVCSIFHAALGFGAKFSFKILKMGRKTTMHHSLAVSHT